MISDLNIDRIVRRHFRFQRIEPSKQERIIVIGIVRECLKINALSKKERDQKFKKIRENMN